MANGRAAVPTPPRRRSASSGAFTGALVVGMNLVAGIVIWSVWKGTGVSGLGPAAVLGIAVGTVLLLVGGVRALLDARAANRDPLRRRTRTARRTVRRFEHVPVPVAPAAAEPTRSAVLPAPVRPPVVFEPATFDPAERRRPRVVEPMSLGPHEDRAAPDLPETPAPGGTTDHADADTGLPSAATGVADPGPAERGTVEPVLADPRPAGLDAPSTDVPARVGPDRQPDPAPVAEAPRNAADPGIAGLPLSGLHGLGATMQARMFDHGLLNQDDIASIGDDELEDVAADLGTFPGRLAGWIAEARANIAAGDPYMRSA